MLSDVRPQLQFTLACGLMALACADAPGMDGNASVDEVLVEVDLGSQQTRVAPADMDRLVENGGDGPVRFQIRDATGEIVAEVRANNFKEAESMLAQQARPMAGRIQANWQEMVESLSSEDLDELMEMVMGRPASSWTQDDLQEFVVWLREKSR